jgi:hypothetical protein
MIVWSYGGGIQSAAIGVLIREGALPVPDLAVIADTGRERRTTWEYLRDVMQPYLTQIGVTVEVAPCSLAMKGLYAADGLTLMPAYTVAGRLPGFCSGEWKRDVVSRWLRLCGVESCDLWIGYSMDEIGRVPDRDRRKWLRLAFPLIDRFVNRAMCVRLIEAAGLPVPSKSRCYMCPHQNDVEWAETLADPIDGPLAVVLDDEVRRMDPTGEGLYLHSSRVPLRLVRAGGTAGIAGPVSPSRPCDGGFCWT